MTNPSRQEATESSFHLDSIREISAVGLMVVFAAALILGAYIARVQEMVRDAR